MDRRIINKEKEEEEEEEERRRGRRRMSTAPLTNPKAMLLTDKQQEISLNFEFSPKSHATNFGPKVFDGAKASRKQTLL